MDDSKFNNLCAHYKDTFENHLSSIKQRDNIFYRLLVLVGLLGLQLSANELVDQAISNFLLNSFHISLLNTPSLITNLIWLLTFGVSAKYFQIVIQIERQYSYLDDLEILINSHYSESTAFTREGKNYLKDYPVLLNWMSILYTVLFPIILIASVSIKTYLDWGSNQQNWLTILCAILIVISTFLYLLEIHRKCFDKK